MLALAPATLAALDALAEEAERSSDGAWALAALWALDAAGAAGWGSRAPARGGPPARESARSDPTVPAREQGAAAALVGAADRLALAFEEVATRATLAEDSRDDTWVVDVEVPHSPQLSHSLTTNGENNDNFN